MLIVQLADQLWRGGYDLEMAKMREDNAFLVAVLEALRVVAIMLNPVTPDLSAKVYGQLGFGAEYATLAWGDAEWGALRAAGRTPPRTSWGPPLPPRVLARR